MFLLNNKQVSNNGCNGGKILSMSTLIYVLIHVYVIWRKKREQLKFVLYSYIY